MIIRKEINLNEPLTKKQEQMLDAMQTRPVQPDEDCPELTDEQIVKMAICKQKKNKYIILLKEVIADGSLPEVSNFRQTGKPANHAKSRAEGSGVILPYGNATGQNDTSDTDTSFLAGLDVQKFKIYSK